MSQEKQKVDQVTWDANHNFLILVCGTDPKFLEDSKMELEEHGYKILHAETSEVALKVLENEPLDLMVIPLRFPKLGGIKLLKEIRENFSSLPLIFYGDDYEADDLEKLIEYSGNLFIPEPFTFEELCAKVRRQLTIKASNVKKLEFLKRFNSYREIEIQSNDYNLSQICNYLFGMFVLYKTVSNSESDHLRTILEKGVEFLKEKPELASKNYPIVFSSDLNPRAVQLSIYLDEPIFQPKKAILKHFKGLCDEVLIESNYCKLVFIKKIGKGAEQEAEPESPLLSMPPSEFKILVVDDSIAIREDLIKSLGERGFDIYSASDGAEGLVRFKSVSPDLIISDVVMPRVDGLRFCKMVKSGPQKDNVYFILLTSQRKTKDKVSGFSMGADDYLTKPFDMEELMARVTTGLKIISLQKSLLNSNKILQAQNVRTMNDIQTAATIQRGLLPDEIKSIKGIKVFTKYIPCRFVGGDYFDVIETSVEGKWAIFSGDVSGHGLGATYITAMLKMSFMMNSPRSEHASEILSSMNKDLARTITTGDFITAFLMVYDENTGILEWSKAGHPPPLYLNKVETNKEMDLLEAQGMPLAVFAGAEYIDHEIKLQTGDRIYIYTDGVTEALNDQEEMYGTDRLIKALCDFHHRDISRTINLLMADVDNYSGNEPLEDDVSHVVLEVQV